MTTDKKQRASPSKKAAREARPNQLDKRITWASQDLDTIMKDLQRDCKPYYKIVDLVRELADISHEVKKLTKDNARIVKAKQKAATDIRALQAEIKAGIAMIKATECPDCGITLKIDHYSDCKTHGAPSDLDVV